MSEVVVRWADGAGALEVGGIDDLDRALSQSWVWVDVLRPDAGVLEALAERFGWHPLATEDILHGQVRPKLDLYPEGPFFVWIAPHFSDDEVLRRVEIDFFLGERVLFTSHSEPIREIEDVAAEGGRVLSRGPDWALHGILDRLVDSLLPPVDAIGDALEEVEDKMLEQPTREDLARLYTLRRRLLGLHRMVGPERDILRELARSRTYVSEEAYRYFDDVGDHIARVEDAIETYRDVGSAVMDIYLSAQSNRMNQIMKTLTVVATIFMPLTLISGIYGMNVIKGMWPPVDQFWSFWAICGSMAAIAVWMVWIFRRRDWW